MSQSRENLLTDGRTNRQTLFYWTLPAEARGPTSFQTNTLPFKEKVKMALAKKRMKY